MTRLSHPADRARSADAATSKRRLKAAISIGIVLVLCATAAATAMPSASGAEPLASLMARIDRNAVELDARRERRSAASDRPPRSAIVTATSANFFVVTSSGDQFARRLLDRAEAARMSLAVDWLGDELPQGRPRVVLHADLGEANTGRTTPAPLDGDGLPQVWIVAPDESTLFATLDHELTHVVLRSRFPQGLPAWANEGAASLSDDAERKRRRASIVEGWVRSREWPSLIGVFQQERLEARDADAYAAAASVTQMLIEERGRADFVRFLERVRESDVDRALRTTYGYLDATDLERAWRRRTTLSIDGAAAQSARRGLRFL